jgi:rubrerythrin
MTDLPGRFFLAVPVGRRRLMSVDTLIRVRGIPIMIRDLVVEGKPQGKGEDMDERQRLNALQVALNNETSEREFYLRHARRTANPLGKAMFEEIASDELEHYQRLKELHEKWESAGKWPESLPLEVRKTTVGKLLDVDRLIKASGEAAGDVDDISAIETAVEFEARGSEFYAELRDALTDPKEKAFFDLLSKIEREHYLSLKDVEEYLKDPVSWLRRTERHSLDGA